MATQGACSLRLYSLCLKPTALSVSTWPACHALLATGQAAFLLWLVSWWGFSELLSPTYVSQIRHENWEKTVSGIKVMPYQQKCIKKFSWASPVKPSPHHKASAGWYFFLSNFSPGCQLSLSCLSPLPPPPHPTPAVTAAAKRCNFHPDTVLSQRKGKNTPPLHVVVSTRKEA